mmetsp:Transcript_15656/g.48993  ORF Transcript_15656/g.48993 Transcript_15656/m.48993 type:complete len:154 (+) Transcript_15656:172-633(+)
MLSNTDPPLALGFAPSPIERSTIAIGPRHSIGGSGLTLARGISSGARDRRRVARSPLQHCQLELDGHGRHEQWLRQRREQSGHLALWPGPFGLRKWLETPGNVSCRPRYPRSVCGSGGVTTYLPLTSSFVGVASDVKEMAAVDSDSPAASLED